MTSSFHEATPRPTISGPRFAVQRELELPLSAPIMITITITITIVPSPAARVHQHSITNTNTDRASTASPFSAVPCLQMPVPTIESIRPYNNIAPSQTLCPFLCHCTSRPCVVLMLKPQPCHPRSNNQSKQANSAHDWDTWRLVCIDAG